MFCRLTKSKNMMETRLVFLFIFLSLVSPNLLYSNPQTEICEFGKIEFATDPNPSNSVPTKPKTDLPYSELKKPFIKFGFVKEAVWVRFNIKEYPRSRCFLRVPQVTLDAAAVFSKSSVQISGDRFPYSERAVDDYYPVFHLEPLEDKNAENIYYLWIQTSSIINFPLILESGLEYEKGSYYRNLIILFMLVLSLFISLLTVFVYRQTLDSIYLNTVGFLIFVSLEGWACFASGYKYLWPMFPEFQNITPPLFALLALACSVHFMYQFLLPSSLPRFFQRMLFVGSFAVLFLAVYTSFLPYRPLAVRIFAWTYIVACSLIIVSTVLVFRSFKPARKITLCMIPIVGSVMVTLLYYLDVFQYNEYTVHAYVLALPTIYIVVMISLSDREKFVRRKTLSRAYDIQQLQEKLRKPDRLTNPESKNKTPSLQFSIDHLFKVERIFKNPELTKDDLASILRITPLDLEQFIQESSKLQSFESYTNQYRVEEAKHLLKTRKDLKPLDIARRSGFISAREMEKSFKLFTGMTPSEYRLMLFPESI
ncbi:helix-turn-helix domain-containing protein [Leptospira sp. 201903071]|uniref:7TM diverse intracellular signaling domain-containing protein n=1 Tax=Leptospira ainazelensis TaxID=2810034 RepID=UPI001963561E|nr:7TM diverse intracellular signaling domain-containing protein [Leptospira ainazelensis]MBM9500865.1 helix-turn-helix domain-containing protein [Leptospira ainazelensis]